MDPQEWLIADKLWRVRNLYQIKRADTGQLVHYTPRREQEHLYQRLAAGQRRLIILKARRLGISTAVEVWNLDEIVFREGFQCSIVDRNENEATLKLTNICKVAFDNLPVEIRRRVKVIRTNDSALEIRTGATTMSAIYAGKGARGGTNQALHISEWGIIQFFDPKRSEEILTGAIPSAEHGTIIVETTWKGGRGGHLWRLVEMAMANRSPGPQEWELLFFPWWQDLTYVLDYGQVEAEVSAYLHEKEAELGFRFTIGQARWYANARRTFGEFCYSEFPTTVDECFKSPIPGAIYNLSLIKLQARGGICRFEVSGETFVHTAWDLGSPMNMVCWYFQIVGFEIHFIDLDHDLECTLVERAALMMGKGYNLGYHYLPHDAQATNTSGETVAGALIKAGLRNVRVVPRTIDIWIGINHVLSLMPRMRFRVPQVDRGLEALRCYHTNRESPSGLAIDIPVHDWSSHYADGLRTFGEAERAGMISSTLSHKTRVRAGLGGSMTGRPKDDPVEEWFNEVGRPRRPRVIR